MVPQSIHVLNPRTWKSMTSNGRLVGTIKARMEMEEWSWVFQVVIKVREGGRWCDKDSAHRPPSWALKMEGGPPSPDRLWSCTAGRRLSPESPERDTAANTLVWPSETCAELWPAEQGNKLCCFQAECVAICCRTSWKIMQAWGGLIYMCSHD